MLKKRKLSNKQPKLPFRTIIKKKNTKSKGRRREEIVMIREEINKIAIKIIIEKSIKPTAASLKG